MRVIKLDRYECLECEKEFFVHVDEEAEHCPHCGEGTNFINETEVVFE